MLVEDIPDNFECVCKICGAKFSSFYFKGGVQDHQNQTSDWNLNHHLKNKTLEEHYITCDDFVKKTYSYMVR